MELQVAAARMYPHAAHSIAYHGPGRNRESTIWVRKHAPGRRAAVLAAICVLAVQACQFRFKVLCVTWPGNLNVLLLLIRSSLDIPRAVRYSVAVDCPTGRDSFMARATACGKAILLGEHAVVYGRPAIAVPVSDVRASVSVATAAGVEIVAADLDRRYDLKERYDDEAALPLQTTVGNTLRHLGIVKDDACLEIVIRSQIPIARGMGSGTAVATAIVRALAEHYGRLLDAGAVSDLVYQTELILHGNPSGVDNTVVVYENPVYFCRGQSPEPFYVRRPFTLLVADTGVPSKTRQAVGFVRQAWEREPARLGTLFDRIGQTVDDARVAIAAGRVRRLGALMNSNHRMLCEMGVSSPELDRLVEAALGSGALGAKLSGGGMGGCMIALVEATYRDRITARLLEAGARRVIPTTVRQRAIGTRQAC